MVMNEKRRETRREQATATGGNWSGGDAFGEVRAGLVGLFVCGGVDGGDIWPLMIWSISAGAALRLMRCLSSAASVAFLGPLARSQVLLSICHRSKFDSAK